VYSRFWRSASLSSGITGQFIVPVPGPFDSVLYP